MKESAAENIKAKDTKAIPVTTFQDMANSWREFGDALVMVLESVIGFMSRAELELRLRKRLPDRIASAIAFRLPMRYVTWLLARSCRNPGDVGNDEA